MQPARPITALALSALLAGSTTASARTLTVCESGCDYTEVSTAIQQATSGDVVDIGEGTYELTGSEVFYDITLRGTGDSTVLEAVADPAIRLIAAPNFVIEQVQLQGDGGVIVDGTLSGGSTTLRQVTHALPAGRAPTTLITASHDLVLASVVLRGNPAVENPTNIVELRDRGSLQVQGCEIRAHNAQTIIEVLDIADVRVSNCLVAGNTLGNAAFSVALSQVAFFNNIVVRDNDFFDAGAGISVNQSTSLRLAGINAQGNTTETGSVVALRAIESGELTQSNFRQNSGQRGPALSLDASSLLVADTVFARNAAASVGGLGGSGGAVFAGDRSDLVVTTTAFLNNSATGRGGALAAGVGLSSLEVIDTTFKGNRAARGGAVALAGSFSPSRVHRVQGGQLIGNSATISGGAIDAGNSGPITFTELELRDTLLLDNRCVGPSGPCTGGGISTQSETQLINVGSWFQGNSAASGGAIWQTESCSHVTAESIFYQNTASGDGGAIHLDTCILTTTVPIFQQSIFVENEATGRGAALRSEAFHTEIVNNSFLGNISEAGGSVSLDPGAGSVINSLFMSSRGGAFHVENGQAPSPYRFFAMYDNDADFSGDAVGTSVTVSDDPLLAGWPPEEDASDPHAPWRWLVDNNSPTIDAGDPNRRDSDNTVSDIGVFSGAFPASPFALDSDKDGWPAAFDCDDDNPEVHPEAVEVCDDANTDEDCNRVADDADPGIPERTVWFRDADGDGIGDPNTSVERCEPPGDHVLVDGDCDDDNPAISPEEVEQPYDGIDNDCDPGSLDDDLDQDGVNVADDCDDRNAAVFPGATEVCNSIDDDCSGDADSDAVDASTWFADTDGDSFGDAEGADTACTEPDGFVANDQDCDDRSAEVSPEAEEVCNEVDDNCDGVTDEDAIDRLTWFADADADTFGDPNATLVQCDQPGGFVADSTDCDDDNGAVYPTAEEVCNELDDDCSGTVDEDATDRQLWFADTDADTFGDPDATELACTMPDGFVNDDQDCDDSDIDSNPAATEVAYDGIDQDCDGADLVDVDEDGHAGGGGPDCDDGDNTVFPGAPEVADDGIDQDCSGDDTVSPPVVIDADEDGHPESTDCDDNDPSAYPGAEELPGTSVDSNCDGWLTDQQVVGVTPFGCSTSSTPLQGAPWLLLLGLARRRRG